MSSKDESNEEMDEKSSEKLDLKDEKLKKLSDEDKEILEIEKLIQESKSYDETDKNTSVEESDSNIEKKEEDMQDGKINSIENKKMKNRRLWYVINIMTVLIVIISFSVIFALLNLGKNTIAKGVLIKGIDVSNLTVEEATNKINESLNVELLKGINLKYEKDYNVDFTPDQIQYKYKVFDAVKQAYSIGKEGNIFQNNYTLLSAAFLGKNIDVDFDYNNESLQGIVDDIASKVPGLVIQASYYIEGNQLIIDKGQKGIEIDKEDLKDKILENLKNRDVSKGIIDSKVQEIEIKANEVDPDPIDIEKIYKEIYSEPKDAYYIPEPFKLFREEEGVDFAITMDEAKAILNENKEEYVIPLKLTPASKTIDDIGTEAFPYLISSYTTKYDASNINRSGNLKIAADKINGTVLMPGEEFSFNEVVGKRTIQDGYKNAKIYENGQVVDGLAGGICQISSTLYNSVLLANLEIVERRNHSYTASYVPAGRDATVVYGTQDFKFKNSRTYPIKLEAKVANGIAEFQIHGIKEEVEYDIKIIPVTTQTIPYQTEYVPTPGLAPGQQVVVQAGHSGYKVTTYIEKRLGGAVISKNVLSNDTYNAMKSIINIGQ